MCHAILGRRVLLCVALGIQKLQGVGGVGVAAVLCGLALATAGKVQDALQLLVVEEVVEAPNIALLIYSIVTVSGSLLADAWLQLQQLRITGHLQCPQVRGYLADCTILQR